MGKSIGEKYSRKTFSKVFTHSALFGVQSVVFTVPNAIYFTIFVTMGILKETEKEKTSTLVGYLSGSFFLGKLISDPIWGVVRDKIGDKNSLTLITIFLFVTLVLFGFSKNLLEMCIGIAFIGLASGVYVPGTAFINWIEPSGRD
jgi:MFS family permease